MARRPNRHKLVEKVRVLANLPPGKKAKGYFNTMQLLTLIMYLEEVKKEKAKNTAIEKGTENGESKHIGSSEPKSI
jgi:hypothetical protein